MYITINLLAVRSSTTALLLAVWGVLILATAFLLAGYCISVSCQLTIMQLSLFKGINHSQALYVFLRAGEERSSNQIIWGELRRRMNIMSTTHPEKTAFFILSHVISGRTG